MAEIVPESVKIENLRGYYNARLSLARRTMLIVGPNNSGKTSVLRLLSWALNDLDLEVLRKDIRPSANEIRFLLPARNARHRARRLTLFVSVQDGRSWRKFQCNDDGLARLRLNIRLTPDLRVYAALGSPSRGEAPVSEANAVELLRRLRENVEFVHVPSFRDARTPRFRETLKEVLRERIEHRALNTTPGGVPSEHTRVSDALQELEDVVLNLASPLWDDVRDRLPPGMARDALVDLDCSQDDLLEFLESRLKLQVTTGEHDSQSVPLTELGSGLQSLLDLAFQEAELAEDKFTVIAAEEPEAFLHPSAQRVVSKRLLTTGEADQTIVTTHSPIVVEEASYGDVVFCRNHKFFEPASVSDEERDAINTALLSGYGAEMVFARSVLLVEGEGDRQFFERLRRRLAQRDDSGRTNQCFVIPVGGNKQFGPWIRLLQSYGDASRRPVDWLIAADADSSTQVRRAFSDAGTPVKQEVLSGLKSVASAHSSDDLSQWRDATRDVNQIADAAEFPLHLMILDLEEAILGNADDEFVGKVVQTIGTDRTMTRGELLNALGAKGFGNGEGNKAPWVRGYVGQNLPAAQLAADTERCIIRWFQGAMSRSDARGLVQDWQANN